MNHKQLVIFLLHLQIRYINLYQKISWIDFILNSIYACHNIDANVKYGLPAASGNLISIRAALGLFIIGILHDADLFLAEYAKITGASKPGISLL